MFGVYMFGVYMFGGYMFGVYIYESLGHHRLKEIGYCPLAHFYCLNVHVFIAAEPIIQGLYNTAVKHGGEVKLTCKVRDQTDTVEWRHFPTSQFGGGDSGLIDLGFDTIKKKDGLFQLVTNDVHSEMAGIYQCSFHKQNITASAHLIILCKYICIK